MVDAAMTSALASQEADAIEVHIKVLADAMERLLCPQSR